MSVSQIKKELKKAGNPQKAAVLKKFFKTGPGQYAEGDIFIGVMVPQVRAIVKKYIHINLKDALHLLRSPIHEERLTALLILVAKYKKENIKNRIFELYLKNTKFINNWDLVDLSAEHIIGAHLMARNRALLMDLSRSPNLWERRIAVLSTFHFIKHNSFDPTFRVSRMLLNDKEDLIHKAVGWMLREVGKRDQKTLEEDFLRRFYRAMPRTMLRYTIERFPAKKRLAYLKSQI